MFKTKLCVNKMNSILKSSLICDKQKSRLIKSGYQSIYLIKSTLTDNGFILFVTGSTLNIYTIKLEGEKITCNCKDTYLFCKHICFVIYYIGNISDELVFLNNKISCEHYSKLIERLQTNCLNDPGIVNDMLNDKFKKRIDFHDVSGIKNIEDDCPVCYSEIKDADLCKCPSCSNAIHENCVKKWLEYNKTCVHCRSDIWKHYNEYINISLL